MITLKGKQPDKDKFQMLQPILIKNCGCKVESGAYAQGFWEKTTLCKKHTAQEKRAKTQEAKRKFEGATTEINCEKCDEFICYVNDSDINCCYFYCKNCKPKNN